MYKEKTNRVFLALGVCLFALGMAAAALWDLQIDIAIHSPTNFAAIWMECFGYYPLYLPALLWLGFEMAAPDRAPWLRGLCAVGQLAGAGALAFISWKNLNTRGVAASIVLTIGVWAVFFVCEGLLLAYALRRGEKRRRKLCFVFRWGTVYLVLETIVVNVLKPIWNRTRFDDMLAQGSFDRFTGWLQPFGHGGSSFPSGHTAAACGIFVLVLLCDVLPGWHRRRTLVWGLCWLYIAGMGFSRIVMGRHYLSDTLSAAFVMSIVFLLMVKSRRYRASLAALPATNAACSRQKSRDSGDV